ncbi:hypothetical protein PN36_03380 [Candidatus Thiomargarita nelsonii]|uniref:Transposase DDE domain-containing protein n=1 Tax=Candidatus Thiomargarita nelsonii TaxID=1003181 RepID=A0A4E0QWG9_9GAMM|nr:hypothetical protein PN36_03380 [Candidatus Thiomargarita nelsonii]
MTNNRRLGGNACWKEYNEALVKRGSLTLWFDEEVIKAWHDVKIIDDRGSPPGLPDSRPI